MTPPARTKQIRPLRRVLLFVVCGAVLGAVLGTAFTFLFPGADARPKIEVRPSASPVPTVTVSPVETPAESVPAAEPSPLGTGEAGLPSPLPTP